MDNQEGRQRSFYPDYLAEIVLVILLCIELLILLVWLFPPLLGREINMLKVYQPRPEWYFLWVFELLKLFPGDLAIVGAVIIPLSTALFIMFIPLMDRLIGRRMTAAIASLLFVLFIILTIIGMI